MRKIISAKFFNRAVLEVAQDLLGKYLVRKIGDEEVALMITEVEAYDGHEDLASHASRGKTKRNEIMFGPAGYFYVYFTYGMHWMLNIVTGPQDYPAAVLIRGAGEISGPARLTKFLKIDRELNLKKAERASELWFESRTKQRHAAGPRGFVRDEDRGVEISPSKIKRTPRIGVDYAGPIWAKKKYRFVFK
ncbi:MAG: DNA-3-methyladenine glycosylase [bacterium]|nr:DNA-3-methyladenine glycosylase [bacterium]